MAGGALVALAGFAAAAAVDSVSFAAVLAALIAIRPRFSLPAAPRMGLGGCIPAMKGSSIIMSPCLQSRISPACLAVLAAPSLVDRAG